MHSAAVARLLLALFAFVALVAAHGNHPSGVKPPTPQPTPDKPNQCNTGSAMCCNSVKRADHKDAQKKLKEARVGVQDPSTPIGLGCSPLSLAGAGAGANCNQSPVCCKNNNFNGVVNIGCSPLNLGF